MTADRQFLAPFLLTDGLWRSGISASGVLVLLQMRDSVRDRGIDALAEKMSGGTAARLRKEANLKMEEYAK